MDVEHPAAPELISFFAAIAAFLRFFGKTLFLVIKLLLGGPSEFFLTRFAMYSQILWSFHFVDLI